jgi:DNA processing protein
MHDPANPANDAALRAWLREPGRVRLRPADAAYPALLREVPRHPDPLYVAGDSLALALPQIAIVGSRNATPDGLDSARRFASHLAERGFCITSGLAEGIDGAAHEGALAVKGRTVAVCGTGLDQVYPRRHTELAARILAGGGALVSEYPPGTPVRAFQFPERNRIISALSVGTLVVEAGSRSGALITARHAAEQGREVFAIPGSIHNPLSRGCHRLIRQGAKLVETAADIFEELSGLLAELQLDAERASAPETLAVDATESDPAYAALLHALGTAPVNTDTLILRSGLTPAELSSMLLILEMQGRVHALPGGRYQRSR